MADKIAICGHCFVGKTTTGKKLAENLGYNFFSIGNYSRQNDLFNYFSSSHKLNDYIHRLVHELLSYPENMVIEGRTIHMSMLSSGYCKNKYLSFLLTADLETQAKRYLKRNNSTSLQEAKNKAAKRNKNLNYHLQQYYGQEVFKENLFDYSIDTTCLTVEDVIDSMINKT